VLDYIRETYGTGGVYVDAGANVGTASLFFAMRCDAEQVYAFEPVPATAALLRENLVRNGATSVHVEQLGLSDERGAMGFAVPHGSAEYCCGARLTPDGDSVSVTTLDAYAAEHIRNRVRVLKVDVEGMELRVLRGATRTIRADKPAIFVEVWDGHHDALDAIRSFMSDHGYTERRQFEAEQVYHFEHNDNGKQGRKEQKKRRGIGVGTRNTDRAREMLADRNYQGAWELGEKIIATAEKCACGKKALPQTHDIMAVSAWWLGRHGDAKHHARIAKELNPGDERVSRNFSLIMTCVPPNCTDGEAVDSKDIETLRAAMDELRGIAARDIPYVGAPGGRGIVLVGGGPVHGPGAWVLANILRKTLGVTLPIELWHNGPAEMTETQRQAYAAIDVTCVDAKVVSKEHPHARLEGWALKPYAIAHSGFREVLYMDADVVPTRDPSALFDTEAFAKCGAIFWRDNEGECKIKIDPQYWEVADIENGPETGVEAGQIVVDKSRCWKPLVMTNWMNERPDVFYEWLYGDKDTFLTAWLLSCTPMALVGGSVLDAETGVFRHNDMSGETLFQHRIGNKWSLGDNPRLRDFVHEDDALEFLKEYPR
jgi:FkbM family methyltransferase